MLLLQVVRNRRRALVLQKLTSMSRSLAQAINLVRVSWRGSPEEERAEEG
jgi:hypothetical protein